MRQGIHAADHAPEDLWWWFALGLMNYTRMNEIQTSSGAWIPGSQTLHTTVTSFLESLHTKGKNRHFIPAISYRVTSYKANGWSALVWSDFGMKCLGIQWQFFPLVWSDSKNEVTVVWSVWDPESLPETIALDHWPHWKLLLKGHIQISLLMTLMLNPGHLQRVCLSVILTMILIKNSRKMIKRFVESNHRISKFQELFKRQPCNVKRLKR